MVFTLSVSLCVLYISTGRCFRFVYIYACTAVFLCCYCFSLKKDSYNRIPSWWVRARSLLVIPCLTSWLKLFWNITLGRLHQALEFIDFLKPGSLEKLIWQTAGPCDVGSVRQSTDSRRVYRVNVISCEMSARHAAKTTFRTPLPLTPKTTVAEVRGCTLVRVMASSYMVKV